MKHLLPTAARVGVQRVSIHWQPEGGPTEQSGRRRTWGVPGSQESLSKGLVLGFAGRVLKNQEGSK